MSKSPPSPARARQLIREYQSKIERLRKYLEAAEDIQGLDLEIENGTRRGAVSRNSAKKTPVIAPTPGITTGLKKRTHGLAPKLPEPWTFDDVLKHVHGVSRSAIRDAVRSLRRDGLVETVEEGKGGKPSKYRFK